ncbi:unnamed protein product [Schistosoma curassoni]|uniref:Uncharacterized protein n=1 Tax=Schistosoma curassoni TaxID=6186 RepID=A0A183KC37_9TREM|nr:unnamed protein product [Schistosoma curassoni]
MSSLLFHWKCCYMMPHVYRVCVRVNLIHKPPDRSLRKIMREENCLH